MYSTNVLLLLHRGKGTSINLDIVVCQVLPTGVQHQQPRMINGHTRSIKGGFGSKI